MVKGLARPALCLKCYPIVVIPFICHAILDQRILIDAVVRFQLYRIGRHPEMQRLAGFILHRHTFHSPAGKGMTYLVLRRYRDFCVIFFLHRPSVYCQLIQIRRIVCRQGYITGRHLKLQRFAGRILHRHALYGPAAEAVAHLIFRCDGNAVPVCFGFGNAIDRQYIAVDVIVRLEHRIAVRHGKGIALDFFIVQRPVVKRIALRCIAPRQSNGIARSGHGIVRRTAIHRDGIKVQRPSSIVRAFKGNVVLAFRHLVRDFIASRLRGHDKRLFIIGRDHAHARHIRNDLSLRLIPAEVLVLRDFFSNRVQHKVVTLSAHFHAQLHRPAGLSVVFNIAADIDHISGGHNGDLFCQRVGSHIQHRDIFQHTAHIGIAIFKQREGCGAIRIPHRSGQIISIRLVFENAAVDSRAGHIADKHAVLDLARIITCDCTAKDAASNNADFCARARVVDRALPECAARNNTAAVADYITIIKHTA